MTTALGTCDCRLIRLNVSFTVQRLASVNDAHKMAGGRAHYAATFSREAG
jgi:hypothetical protein